MTYSDVIRNRKLFKAARMITTGLFILTLVFVWMVLFLSMGR